MSRRVNLIPMAGAGKRFVDAGYAVPKPLIDVAGLPMIVRAARSLPKPDLWIFVCRAEHVRDAGIDVTLRKLFSPCEIVVVDRLTEGQACTCLLARHLLRPDDQLCIGACDNSMTWSSAAYAAFENDPASDFAVWTFRNNRAVLQDPRMYGWVRLDDSQKISEVSVKVPISSEPLRDHAVVGAFSFKRAELFLRSCDEMIRNNARVKNEFYVDMAVNFAVREGSRGTAFEVDRYICWGTPADLELFEYWHGYFRHVGL